LRKPIRLSKGVKSLILPEAVWCLEFSQFKNSTGFKFTTQLL
jgi:hypothetical protein